MLMVVLFAYEVCSLSFDICAPSEGELCNDIIHEKLHLLSLYIMLCASLCVYTILLLSWINWGIKWCSVKPRAPVDGVDKIQVEYISRQVAYIIGWGKFFGINQLQIGDTGWRKEDTHITQPDPSSRRVSICQSYESWI